MPPGTLFAGAVAERFGPSASLLAGAAGIAIALAAVRVIRPLAPEAA